MTNDALQTLQEMFAVCGNERRMKEAFALDAAIRALCADRGEAVPYGWIEPETGNFVDHATKLEMPADAATFTLAVYATPPSPAESADPEFWPEWVMCAVRNANDAGRLAGRAESAAPSGVSDAMVDRALDEFFEPHEEGHDETIRRLMRSAIAAALEAAQPQPGRVEGMDHG